MPVIVEEIPDFGTGFPDDFGGGFSDGFGGVDIERCQVVDPQTNTCIVCDYGYVWKGNSCDPVSRFCDTFDVQTGDCFTCKFGLPSPTNGRCQDPNCQVPNQ